MMAAFLVLSSLLFVIKTNNAACGYYFGQPLDVCTNKLQSESAGILSSAIYTCSNDVYQVENYDTFDCTGSVTVENVSANCVAGNELGNACNCGDGGDCDVIHEYAEYDCDQVITGEFDIVKATCFARQDLEGSFKVTCNKKESQGISYEEYDDYECQCKTEELTVGITSCTLYQNGAGSADDCGHYGQYPLDECYSSNIEASYKYTCDDEGNFYKKSYEGPDCVDDNYMTPDVDVSWDCTFGSKDCYCASSAACDIMKSSITQSCTSTTYYLYVTNVCLATGEGDYEQYACNYNKKEELYSTYFDSACTQTEDPCPGGYTIDCEYAFASNDDAVCGSVGGITLGVCTPQEGVGYILECDSSSGEELYFQHTYDDTSCNSPIVATLNMTDFCGFIECVCGTPDGCNIAEYTDCANEDNKHYIPYDIVQCMNYGTDDDGNALYTQSGCDSDIGVMNNQITYYDADCTITTPPLPFDCDPTYDQENVYYDCNYQSSDSITNCGYYQGTVLDQCIGYEMFGQTASMKYECESDGEDGFIYTRNEYSTIDCTSSFQSTVLETCIEGDDCNCDSSSNCNIAEGIICDVNEGIFIKSYGVLDICIGDIVQTCEDGVYSEEACDVETEPPTDPPTCSVDLSYDGCAFTPSPTKNPVTSRPTSSPIDESTTEEPRGGGSEDFGVSLNPIYALLLGIFVVNFV